MIHGKCLCGVTEFACDIQTNPLKIYQCHCSLCKKQTGSSSNSATIIPMADFKWVNKGQIKSWQKETGFSAHFCGNCGCPVPNLFANQYYWIPIGLLEIDNPEASVEVVAHLCLSTKSSWHQIDLESESKSKPEKFETLPDFKHLLKLLS